jgi:hypothetical protein
VVKVIYCFIVDFLNYKTVKIEGVNFSKSYANVLFEKLRVLNLKSVKFQKEQAKSDNMSKLFFN